MIHTPLTATHIELGAKMAEFAGYNMPISYSSIKEEHLQVRRSVGVFDVSHMGEFILRGKEVIAFINSITSNDASKMAIGDAQYTCMPNDSGGIVDDMIIYRLPEDKCADGESVFMLVVNASNIEKDLNWIKSKNTFDVKLADISNDAGLLAVQGPNAQKVLQKLTEIDLDKIEYYNFKKGEIAGITNVVISATGYTGSGGFELYVSNHDLKKLWDEVMSAGKEFGILPIGLGARDTLRLEMGYCLYGNDINDLTSPIEAGLKWITKLNKVEDFPSKELFARQVDEGVNHRLVGFEVNDRRVPRQGYKILNEGQEEIGYVTSGSLSPSLEIPIGMGYVRKELSKIGTSILVDTGKKHLTATIIKLPFYKKL